MLSLQLLGLVPGLLQQLLRVQVTLEHLQVQRDGGKQLVEQGLLPGTQGMEGGDLDHGQQGAA